MKLAKTDLDWQRWSERWDAMQNCYVPQRVYRFDLMLRLADLPREAETHILELGCGPGSLAFRALRHYPRARILAVDWDPILLKMGEHLARGVTDRIQFVQADIREASWWADLENSFDLIMSATALHWLNANDLVQLYRRVHRALKPGGWFMNSDHIASDDPTTQVCYRQMLHVNQQSAFQVTNADDWDGFWREMGTLLGRDDLLSRYNESGIWDGTDDGQPRQFHVTALQECGFGQIAFHWQDLGEAVIGARKA